MRFTIKDLFVLILLVAVAIVTVKAYWNPSPGPYPPLAVNDRIVFTGYLALLVVATYSSRRTAPPIRSFSIGYALFGWVYLVCMLRAGFGDEDIGGKYTRADRSLLGLGIGIAVGLCTYFVDRFARGNEKPK